MFSKAKGEQKSLHGQLLTPLDESSTGPNQAQELKFAEHPQTILRQ